MLDANIVFGAILLKNVQIYRNTVSTKVSGEFAIAILNDNVNSTYDALHGRPSQPKLDKYLEGDCPGLERHRKIK